LLYIKVVDKEIVKVVNGQDDALPELSRVNDSEMDWTGHPKMPNKVFRVVKAPVNYTLKVDVLYGRGKEWKYPHGLDGFHCFSMTNLEEEEFAFAHTHPIAYNRDGPPRGAYVAVEVNKNKVVGVVDATEWEGDPWKGGRNYGLPFCKQENVKQRALCRCNTPSENANKSRWIGHKDDTDVIFEVHAVEGLTPVGSWGLNAPGSDKALSQVYVKEFEQYCPLMQGHTARVSVLHWDGEHLISGSVDGSVRIWECAGENGDVTRHYTCLHDLNEDNREWETRRGITSVDNCGDLVVAGAAFEAYRVGPFSSALSSPCSTDCDDSHAKITFGEEPQGSLRLWCLSKSLLILQSVNFFVLCLIFFLEPSLPP